MASIYVDEHVPRVTVRALGRAGHHVLRGQDLLGQGAADEAHLERAIAEGATLLTQDTDFLSLATKVLSEGKHHPGIVYWPQGKYGTGEVIRRLRQYFQTTSAASRRDMVKFL